MPLFLDDNPRVTVMEIRAKARRMKARHGGLALIVIDYLQLMGGGGTAENRQLEVSEISRNLKILARELEVPIVALSQLSRNLESRSDKRPMLSDLRESGCLTADTRSCAPTRTTRSRSVSWSRRASATSRCGRSTSAIDWCRQPERGVPERGQGDVPACASPRAG